MWYAANSGSKTGFSPSMTPLSSRNYTRVTRSHNISRLQRDLPLGQSLFSLLCLTFCRPKGRAISRRSRIGVLADQVQAPASLFHHRFPSSSAPAFRLHAYSRRCLSRSELASSAHNSDNFFRGFVRPRLPFWTLGGHPSSSFVCLQPSESSSQAFT
jgi:hypothetical protein